VAELIGQRLPVSVPLACGAVLLSAAIALPAGISAAGRRGRAADAAVMGLAQIGMALPNFWLGLLLILLFAVHLGWLPAGGFPGWAAGAAPAARALALPVIALALPQAAVLARVTRGAVGDTLGMDFLRTARAKGLSRRAALWRHAVPNALVPIITIIGLQLSFLIAGAVIIENVFALPGLGRLLFQAIGERDLPVVQDIVVLLAALVIVVNFLVDLAAAAIDPRLRG
jgi:peptide/nickel transport system permease protein